MIKQAAVFFFFLIPCQPFLLAIHCDMSDDDDDDRVRMWVFCFTSADVVVYVPLWTSTAVEERAALVYRLIVLVLELTSALALRGKVNILVIENPLQVLPCSKV